MCLCFVVMCCAALCCVGSAKKGVLIVVCGCVECCVELLFACFVAWLVLLP